MKIFKIGKKLLAVILALMLTLAFTTAITVTVGATDLPSYNQTFDTADTGTATTYRRYSADNCVELNPNNGSLTDGLNSYSISNGKLTAAQNNTNYTSVWFWLPQIQKVETEISFDLTWLVLPTSGVELVTFLNLQNSQGTNFLNLRYSASGKIRVGASGTQISDSGYITTNTTYNYKININFETEAMKVGYKKSTETDYTWVDLTEKAGSEDIKAFSLGMGGNSAGTFELDNLLIKQVRELTTVDLVSDNIDAHNVSLNPFFELNFSGELTNTNGITLHQGGADGSVVATSALIDGTKVQISPNSALTANTKYTMVLDKSLTGGVEGRNISFYTGAEKAEVAADFNSLTSSANAWNIIEYLAQKGITMAYAVRTNVGWMESENQYNQWKEFLIDTNNIKIENGALHIKGDCDATYGGSAIRMWPTADSRMSAKKLKFDFDIKYGNHSEGSFTPFMSFTSTEYGWTSGVAARFDHISGFFLHETYNSASSSWTHGIGNTYQVPSEWTNYSIVLDYENAKWYVSINGGTANECDMDPSSTFFREIYMMISLSSGISTNELWLDNIRITELSEPEISYLVTDENDTAVDKIEAGKGIKTFASFENNVKTPTDAFLLVALYNKNGVLLKAECTTAAFAGSKATFPELTYTAPEDLEDGAYIKFFALNSSGELKPLVKNASFSAQ